MKVQQKRVTRTERNASASGAVPRFFLYGLEEQDTDHHFVHVEAIEDRLAVHSWHVRPHMHAHLHQFILFAAGGGRFLIEDRWQDFRAPALMVLPAGVVHGFELEDGTNAPVVTISEAFRGEIAAGVEPAVAHAFDAPHFLKLDQAGLRRHALPDLFEAIRQDYLWRDLGQITAISARLSLLFVAVARLVAAARGAPGARSRQEELFARFRAAVEDHFREHRAIGDYADALAITEGRLNALCRRVSGRSALAVVHARLVTEAKRLLLYSMMSVSEIAYTLGYKDPAYFSRFFTRAAGEPPLAFRQRHAAERAADQTVR